MDFNDIVSLLRQPPEGGNPDSIYDDLTGAYTRVLGRSDSADAKIAELEAANEALLAQVNDLKSKNYDLLMAVDNGSEVAEDAAEDIDDETAGVDDLISYDDDSTDK